MDWKSLSRISLLFICCILARSFVTSENSRYVEFRKPSCSEAACHPITGNLLIGRANRLTASSTCGLYEKQRYCIVSHLEEKKKCFNCDSRPGAVESLSHRIENVIHRDRLGSTDHTWWQSENGKEDVSISLNLEAEFHFTHLIMKFRTFRPAAMLVERSFDFGKTWSTYRYFAENCPASFPNVPTSNILTDVFCESTYSQVYPVTGGEVILRIITPKNQTQPKYELVPEDLRNLMKMTNLRINFTKLHTLGDDLLDKREEIQEKYYYAVYEMNVRGACWCNGHADSCVPLDDSIRHVTDMVHGRCDCWHNTTGLNCQFCKDTHNDLPWKPAIGRHLNACKKCNCNNHANRCNFSKEVYQESGHISGSVCIDCQHNTTGNTCEQCKPLFYHDPNRDLTDPYTCLPCNCNTDGTIDQGLCDPPIHTQYEGVCHCKQNVWGNRCNECKPGFWNLDANNPDGCQPCECDLRGTLNATCDQVTGRCSCKRNVIGTNCSECYPEHWGLSKDTDGCTPCGCDPGGSVDPNCDITGQCKCYPNLLGRTCSVPKQGFFIPDLDTVYEAEDASCHPNCQLEVLERPRVGKPTWTGRGYNRVYDNSQLEFTIDNVPTSSEFDLIVRYKVMNNEGVDAIATLQRPSSQPAGVCANSQDIYDTMYIQLQPGSLYSKAETPICLESGKPYKLILKFKSYSNQVDGPAASILIDSIAFVPRPDTLDFFNRPPLGNDRITEYYDLECDEVFNGVQRPQIPEKCKKYHYSISVKLNQGAQECLCNLTGSFSAFCEPFGGTCACKEKIVGRTCDHCAPGTWGFGPNGCTDCDCNSIGALNNLCDPYTGQCTCNNGIYGRSCDQCQPGSYGFPDCRPCQCHGHAHSCKDNGECIECRDFTTGHSCDRCSDGYYGDPTSLGTPCQPCRCPDTVESGHSFATTCKFNQETRDVTCVCKPGYTGPRCDVCANNYYGNPEIVGGSCRECDCSGNIDLSLAGNCDSSTGKCLQCLNHTTGFLCDECEAGYFGDPLVGDCKECNCNLLGTDKDGGPCDPVTGRCPCLPNVQGLRCNECVANHWLIALGKGCILCACDPIGSKSSECNKFTGECDCKDGFGGKKCNQCQKNFWGDPNEECYPCSCDLEGSVNGECHQTNGSCICLEGVGGDKCDVCAVGHDGAAPECFSCGECFHNWNSILNELSDTTRNSVRSAGEIMRTGSTGYNAAFDTLNKHIDNINSTLTNTNKNTDHLDKLNSQVNIFRDNLSSSSESVKKFSSQVEDVISNISLANVLLETISERAQQLEVAAHNLSKAATHLQKQDRKGALNLTREAGEASKNVSAMEKYVKGTVLTAADLQCRKTERFLNKEDSFTLAEENQDKKRSQLDFSLSLLEKGVPKLNNKICDKEGDPCDTLCGGAGCGKCGGSISCESGAVGKAAAARMAVKYKDHIADSLKNADSSYRAIANASQMCGNASESASKVHAAAVQLKDKWEMSVNSLAKLNKDMDDFVKTSGTNSAEIRQVANETLSLNIQLKHEQITELARKINESIDSLKDVKTILNSTRNDQAVANELKSKSDDAKKDAENVLMKAQNVLDGLKVADDVQQKAGKEIEMANNNITAIKQDLRQIESEMTNAAMNVNSTAEIVSGKIKEDMYRLRTVLFMDKDEGERIADVAKSVAEQVKNARNKVGQLDTQYGEVNMKLRQKETVTDSSKLRAQKLLHWAQLLSLNTTTLLKELRDADVMYNDLDKKLTHISDEIDSLTTTVEMHIKDITTKSESYRDC